MTQTRREHLASLAALPLLPLSPVPSAPASVSPAPAARRLLLAEPPVRPEPTLDAVFDLVTWHRRVFWNTFFETLRSTEVRKKEREFYDSVQGVSSWSDFRSSRPRGVR